MRKPYAVLLGVAVALVAGVAGATPHGTRPEPAVSEDGTSLSIGMPHRGRLLSGSLLAESNYLRYRSGDSRFRNGTDELVYTLEQAAKHVSDTVPGARLTVGDLSLRNGGRFRPHRSHRNGRDVDIAFYLVDAEGDPVYADRFVRIGANGQSRDSRHPARFDDARNWELVASLLESQVAGAQYLFVSRPLKARLLAEGRRRGASPDLLARAELALDQPRRGGRHDDHFHVRVYCADSDRPRCVDPPPYHPWFVPRADVTATEEQQASLLLARPRSAVR